MTLTRLIIDPPARGSWNMAVDEAILRSAPRVGMPTLRFYEWSEPTLSLGYFQKYEERWQHAASGQVACVRRASGGGAILHDRELTYSFVAPVEDARSDRVTAWFDFFHETLIQVLRHTGVSARLSGKPQASAPAEPFLCFQRRHEVDVIVGDFKICGSAQRRHQDAILQHGSVLLQQSPAAPELPGIQELADRKFSTRSLIDLWTGALSQKLEISYASRTLTSEEYRLAQKTEQEKFAAESWTKKR